MGRFIGGRGLSFLCCRSHDHTACLTTRRSSVIGPDELAPAGKRLALEKGQTDVEEQIKRSLRFCLVSRLSKMCHYFVFSDPKIVVVVILSGFYNI